MIYGVSADVLGNSACFTSRHTRLADRIHQRRLTVIDVAHEGDDRTARFEFLFFFNNRRRRRDNYLFYLVNAGSFFTAFFFENEPVILRDFRRDVGFDCLIDVRENVKRHQLGNELVGFQTELDRELLHNNWRFDVNDVLRSRFGFGSSCFSFFLVDCRSWLRFSSLRRRRSWSLERCANPRDRRQHRRFLFDLAVRNFLLRMFLVDQRNAFDRRARRRSSLRLRFCGGRGMRSCFRWRVGVRRFRV